MILKTYHTAQWRKNNLSINGPRTNDYLNVNNNKPTEPTPNQTKFKSVLHNINKN
jgi:hypothetical protein